MLKHQEDLVTRRTLDPLPDDGRKLGDRHLLVDQPLDLNINIILKLIRDILTHFVDFLQSLLRFVHLNHDGNLRGISPFGFLCLLESLLKGDPVLKS